jgi:putative PIN family toxin of toxin-antitoxin system
MLRVVFDTNVVVSGLLSPSGPLASLINLAALRRFRCYVSQEILTEYQDVLGRAYLGVDEPTARKAILSLRKSSVLVKPTKRLAVCRDIGDNKFLECALAARVDYLVTGNLRHVPRQFQDIRVISPRQFLTALVAEPR